MRAPLPDFAAIRLLVAGDAMLDRYWSGDAGRISPEAPVPVVDVRDEELRAGGAANVAANAAALGAAAALLAPVGGDAAGRALAKLLRRHRVEPRLLAAPGRATAVKLRVVSRHQQLLRLDFGDRSPIRPGPLRTAFRRALARCDAVVLSDYGHGALADPQPLIRLARDAGRPVFVDPKRPDFAAYAGADAVTPNRRELEAAAGRALALEEIPEAAARLCRRHRIGALLVTLGAHGMLLQRSRRTDRLACAARDVFDVTGAGDTVIAAYACARAAGAEPVAAMRLANLAAGRAVGKFGTATVARAELAAALDGGAPRAGGAVSRPALRRLVREARARGETVVLTNGCFDLLHAGHLQLLEQAAALGDRLVVAVNTDASVRRLKGPGRPAQPLADRRRLLAGLACVDWVTAFGEDTPAKLIGELLPDVLVKGADYAAAEVAGAAAVRRAGGRVELLPLAAGRSTSGLLERIRGGRR